MAGQSLHQQRPIQQCPSGNYPSSADNDDKSRTASVFMRPLRVTSPMLMTFAEDRGSKDDSANLPTLEAVLDKSKISLYTSQPPHFKTKPDL